MQTILFMCHKTLIFFPVLMSLKVDKFCQANEVSVEKKIPKNMMDTGKNDKSVRKRNIQSFPLWCGVSRVKH